MSFEFSPLEPGSFDFVMIDVSWEWETWSPKGAKKSPIVHYKPMPWSQVERLPVRQLLAPGGVVWIWGTWPLFGRQHLIAENCWGLKVQTGGAWSKRTKSGKLRWGPGHIIRSVCEPFMIATMPGHKLRGKAEKNLIECLDKLELHGVARRHSEKPEEAYELVERLTPGWRRADIYARWRRDGWTGFGDELGKFNKAS